MSALGTNLEPSTNRAQFHRAAKHNNLLSSKFLSGFKRITKQNVHVIFRITKQQLITSNKQYAANGNLIGIGLFSYLKPRKKFHAKQFIVLSGSVKFGPGEM